MLIIIFILIIALIIMLRVTWICWKDVQIQGESTLNLIVWTSFWFCVLLDIMFVVGIISILYQIIIDKSTYLV